MGFHGSAFGEPDAYPMHADESVEQKVQAGVGQRGVAYGGTYALPVLAQHVGDAELLVGSVAPVLLPHFLVQALGVAACRNLHKVRYVRLADLFDDLARCRSAADGSLYEHMDYYKRVDLLILDDFLTTPTDVQGAIDLFEIIESREGRAATLVASQLEPNEWYLRIEGELMADSILNRIATRARFVDLGGPNMREYLAKQDER